MNKPLHIIPVENGFVISTHEITFNEEAKSWVCLDSDFSEFVSEKFKEHNQESEQMVLL